MGQIPAAKWFEMAEIRRRKLANAIWIPLRQAEHFDVQGKEWQPGYQEELVCAGTLAVLQEHRALAEKLGWSDIGLIHSPRPYAFKDGRYKPADVYLHNDREQIGVELVLTQP